VHEFLGQILPVIVEAQQLEVLSIGSNIPLEL
jgi:hypothetical protein